SHSDSDSNDDMQSDSYSDLGSNNKTRSKRSSLTIYFAQVRESLPPEKEKINEEMSIKKDNKTSIIMKEIQAKVLEKSSHIKDKQIIKPAINFNIGTLEEDFVALIEELPIPT
ncbi:11158_t:CDS:1, partial [Acaulospora morrowiae]